MYCWFHTCVFICKKISSRTLVIPRNWIRNKAVFYLQRKDRKENGTKSLNWWWSNSEKADTQFSELESIVSRNAQKQRRWKIIFSLLCRWRYDWNCFSHNSFCQPSQYLRSSLRCVWRIQQMSNKDRETCCGRAMWPTFRASKLVDNDT